MLSLVTAFEDIHNYIEMFMISFTNKSAISVNVLDFCIQCK